MRQLLDGGADVNKATTTNGHTPLYTAAYHGKLMALQCLLDDAAQTNIATADGRETPLYAAAAQGFLEVVRCLIVCGADVNAARSDGGGTALQIASQEGYYSVALILLKGGAQAVIEAARARPSSADSLPEQRMLRLLARWRCATCDRPLRKEKTCDRCRSVSYCSRECQRGHWAQHKAACSPESALSGLHRA
jgi:hypothetical protein